MNEMKLQGELNAIKGALALLLAVESIDNGLPVSKTHEILVNEYIGIIQLERAHRPDPHRTQELEAYTSAALDHLFLMTQRFHEALTKEDPKTP